MVLLCISNVVFLSNINMSFSLFHLLNLEREYHWIFFFFFALFFLITKCSNALGNQTSQFFCFVFLKTTKTTCTALGTTNLNLV